MHPIRAQGAIGLPSATAGTLHAQGATEYLVLLAVVLIIALVSIALLGFFPGMATDAQITENQLYWKSATPLAIIETGGVYASASPPEYEYFYMRIRNTGSYAITLSKIWAEGDSLNGYFDPTGSPTVYPFFNTITIAPGGEECFGSPWIPNQSCKKHSIEFGPPDWGTGSGLLAVIQNGTACDSQGKGTLTLKNFGFEYSEIIEGQSITKKQIGTKPLMIRCAGIRY